MLSQFGFACDLANQKSLSRHSDVLELYRWQGDTETLHALWPVVKNAANWQMNVSAADGTPAHLWFVYQNDFVLV